jgi:hypothetical protein
MRRQGCSRYYSAGIKGVVVKWDCGNVLCKVWDFQTAVVMKTKTLFFRIVPVLFLAGLVSGCDTMVETESPAGLNSPTTTTVTTGRGWTHDEATTRSGERVGHEGAVRTPGM